MKKCHKLLGCHTTGINNLLIFLLCAMRCVYASYNASSKKSCGKNLLPSLTTNVINITAFFKVISSGDLSSISIKILVLSNFSMPIIFLILSNTISRT